MQELILWGIAFTLGLTTLSALFSAILGSWSRRNIGDD